MRFILGLILILSLYSTSNSQDLDGPVGVWHANSNGWPITVSISRQGDKYVAFVAAADSKCNQRLDSVTWDAKIGSLEFRHAASGITQWYRVMVADGLMIGRFTHENATKAGKPTDPLAYKYHVTGWSQDYFQSVTPVVFDINGKGFRGRLRIDRLPDGKLIGRLKMYAYENSMQEYGEEEITVKQWDGETLAFTRTVPQAYTGSADGRYISGSFTHAGNDYKWSGRRAEILTYGIAPKTPEWRATWQKRTRQALYRLMMAGNLAPLSANVEILADDLPPIDGGLYPLRDDDPDAHPQNYKLTELRLTHTLPNWLGGEPITRVGHAYLAKPTTPPPGNLTRYPLVLAVNGHMGSAYKVMDGGSPYWHGDAWARRGYIVLAVDIGHRPGYDVVRARDVSDLSTYLGYPDENYPGDDPAHGNGLRPSIKPPKPAGVTDADWAYSTDWEEDGERVWDVMRALDYALSRSDVDPQRIVVTGLSLGGEVASYVGALDPRIRVSLPSGYSPDLSVFKYLRSVGHCMHWSFADIREYIDHSDVLALTAPRPLIVQTGRKDLNCSHFPQYSYILPPTAVGVAPFAADKQVMRRARAAYDGGPIFHYLHPLGHEYRTGALSYPTVIEPTAPGDLLWQANGNTATDGRNLFDYVRQFLNF